MYKFSDSVYNTDEVIFVNRKRRQKNSVLNVKSIAVIASVAAFVAVFGVVMNLAAGNRIEKSRSFDSEAWKQATEEAEQKLKADEAYNAQAETVLAEVAPAKTEENSERDNQDATTESDGENSENDSAKFILSMPVEGVVTKDYSGEELVYSETMGDWRSHNGIDIFANEGSEVKAAADGTVEAVTDGGMFGKTVVIIHSGGLRTIYSNLAMTEDTSVGKDVKVGEKIGLVGSTAAAESAEPSHLHFEVSLNEETVNPHDYMPVAEEVE